jgi:hypothetical protein
MIDVGVAGRKIALAHAIPELNAALKKLIQTPPAEHRP